MPHKRTKESQEKRRPRSDYFKAMAHTTMREKKVEQRAKQVAWQEQHATKINNALLAVAGNAVATLDDAARLAAHHLTDDHEENTKAAHAAAEESAPLPALPAMP